MNRKVLVLALAIMALSAWAAFAQTPPPAYTDGDAYSPEGYLLPAGAVNPGTYQWENGAWVPATFAITRNSIGSSSSGMSNKEFHSFEIINHVSVAQWVDYTISGTRKDWRVLRPGTYASDSVTATLRSNNDLIISFWAEDPSYLGDGGVTQTIAKWFGYSEGDQPSEVDQLGWVRAADTSLQEPFTFTVADSADLHAGLAYKIWEKIEVLPSNSSSDYHGLGHLTIQLSNMKHWVDGENGTFAEVQQ